MTLTITTTDDQLAILQVINQLDNRFSWAKHLAMYAEHIKPTDSLTIHIRKSLLPNSYTYNPSLLAKQIKSHNILFRDASGQQSDKEGYIKITIYRNPRQLQSGVPVSRVYAGSFIGSIIKQIQEGHIVLIPIDEIPDGWRRRPEQLTYNVKRNTDGHTQIKIKQLKTSWRIQAK